jgi:DNA-directed RNA polymerase specialized sigma subunit
MFYVPTSKKKHCQRMSNNNNFQSQVDINLNKIAWRFQREIPLDIEEVELLLSKRASPDAAEERESYQKRKEKMVNELFVAATKVLTEVQFQFFSSYYVLGMSEVQIADAFKVTQPYVSIVLSASVKKIRKHLNLS